tara:strand:- start:2331 stop:5567 length:3237 start_codon:yes stop_codon:yes gene_type:complete
MSEYTDLTLLNCNRSASVEARTGNDTNPAVFTNPLQQTVKLDVGDRVSVERAFINELGAGNPSTIEFSGKSKGFQTIPNYIEVIKSDFFYQKATTFNANYRLGNHRTVDATLKIDEQVDLRDNFAPMIFGYYITANEYPNYIQQPRNFTQSGTRAVQPTAPDFFTNKDQISEGSCKYTVNPQMYMESDWAKRNNESGGIIYKQRVDCKRYTMFIKENFCFSADILNDIPKKQFPTTANGVFSTCKYLRYRERLDIEINKGFNTPAAVAEQITRKLTETKTPEVFEILDGAGFNRPITKKIESSTYKPIDCATFWNYNAANYTAYKLYGGGAPTQAEVDWISQFGYIGVKRPEIFEAGRKMVDEIVPITLSIGEAPNAATKVTRFYVNAEYGFQIAEYIDNLNIPIRYAPTQLQFEAGNPDLTLNVRYTESNLKLIRDFLDSQTYYPEIWDDLLQTEDYKLSEMPDHGLYPDITNSRFFHMNRMAAKTDVVPHSETLGEDTFKEGVGGEDVNKSSSAVFFEYDESTRDLYIEPKDYQFQGLRKLMYGFCEVIPFDNFLSDGTSEVIYLIGLRARTRGGLSKDLFTHQPLDGLNRRLLNGTRIGFDKHATAYSTCIITPHSGYANCGIPTVSEHITVGGGRATQRSPPTTTYMNNMNNANAGVDLGAYQTMTYVGANNPLLQYDTTLNRFVFKRLHTGNNVGNKYYAGSDSTSITNESLTPPQSVEQRIIAPPDRNNDAGETVYKLCPRPPQFGYSPTFKPYAFANQAYRIVTYPKSADQLAQEDSEDNFAKTGDNTNIIEGSNLNIEPYEIFDAHGGIYIDYWGYDKKDTAADKYDHWANNMWDILGFDYDVVVAPPSAQNVLTKRVNNDNNDALYRPTTNAEVSSTDTKTYVCNQFGANMFYTSLPYPENILQYTTDQVGEEPAGTKIFKFIKNGAIGTPLTFYPEVAVKTQSIGLIATNLQRSVLKPYYTIRSSLIQGYSSIGGNPTGANLPLIDIIDKYSAANDYFMGSPSGMVFTITKQTIISDIITSIHDPDGEYSNVNSTSAVVYKIEKNKITPQNIFQEIMEQAKKENKKKK